MMRSLHRSVLRTNKATHKLLKNIEERKKELFLSPVVSTTFSPESSTCSSESETETFPSSVPAVAVQPFQFVKSRFKIHPSGNEISVGKNPKEITQTNSISVATSRTEIDDSTRYVKNPRLNYSESDLEEGEGQGEGEEEGQGEGEGEGRRLEQGEGEEWEEGGRLEQEEGAGWRQGAGNEHEQCQYSNACASAVPNDLVSNLQDAVGHLDVAYESNVCLGKLICYPLSFYFTVRNHLRHQSLCPTSTPFIFAITHSYSYTSLPFS